MSQPVGVVEINVDPNAISNYGVAIGAAVVVCGSPATSGTVINLPEPAAAGDLVVFSLLSGGPVAEITSLRSNGVAVNRTALAKRVQRVFYGTKSACTWVLVASGGEQFFVAEWDNATQFMFTVLRISGEARVPPYSVPSGGGQSTPSWTSKGRGIVLAFNVFNAFNLASPGVFPALPAGWDLIAQCSSTIGQISWRSVAAAGAQSAEPYGAPAPVGTSFVVLLPLYQLGLRVRPGGGVWENIGGQVMEPGYVERPTVTDPFEPAALPLPEPSTPIEVPLPPWVPGPGPYRPS